jgi:DNA-binding transcriptional MerR regulator
LSKAVDAFRNIGEVAAELGVKKHVLRFWELKFPQLKPMKRGGGRRLYRPSDVELLKGIRDLLQNAGYTIKGVQRLLREHGTEHVKHAGDLSPAAKDKAERRARSVRIARAGTSGGRSVELDALEVQALRAIMAELDACRELLAAAGESPAQLHERTG